MEKPDVVLEVIVKDDKATMSYKVFNRNEGGGVSASEFVDIVGAIFGNVGGDE